VPRYYRNRSRAPAARAKIRSGLGSTGPVKLRFVPEDQPTALTPGGPSRGATMVRLLGFFLLYVLLAVLATRPLAWRLAEGVPHDLADPVLNTWILWWNAQALPFSAGWWNGPIFHPIPGVLSFSENLVGLAPLTTPLQWLGARPLAAYNAAFILSFALSAFSMHLLGRALGLKTGPCVVAGLAYGFAPYRAVHLAHLQVLSAFHIPLVFLGAHRFVQTGRRPWLALFGAAWLLQGLTNGYFLVFVSVLLGAWLSWFVASAPHRGRVVQLLLAWAVACACLAPVLVRYALWHKHYGLERRMEEIESLSADVLGLIASPPGLAHWAGTTSLTPESCLFPGLTQPAILQAFLVASRGWRRNDESRATLLLAAVAALAATTAAVTAVTGPWRFGLGPLALTVTALSKPLAIAFYGLILAAISSRSLRSAWRSGSVPAFYLLAGVAMMILAFGPNPRARGLKVWDKAPYFYLLKLPGVEALRAPSRFAMPGVFCLTLAGAIGLGRLAERRGRPGQVLVALAAAGVLWDGWLDRLPIHEAPADVALPARGSAASVLELPLGEERDTSAMYRAMAHGLPVVNGYSGYPPPHYLALRLGLARREPGVLGALRERGPVLVLIDPAADDVESLRRLVRSEADARQLEDAGTRSVYLLPREAPHPEPAFGPSVAFTVLHGSPRRGVFRLAEAGPVGGVRLLFGAGVSSLPARVTVEVGDGPGRWTIVWDGPIAARALRGALRDPRRVPVTLETAPASGRLLRIRVDGTWTIEEVVVLRPRAG
jgi:hypothetical protein